MISNRTCTSHDFIASMRYQNSKGWYTIIVYWISSIMCEWENMRLGFGSTYDGVDPDLDHFVMDKVIVIFIIVMPPYIYH